MAKQSGLGDNLYVAGVDVSGDIGSLSSISSNIKPIEVTAIDKSAMERLGGQRDGSLEFTAFFNPSAGQEHSVFSALPTADQVVTYFRGLLLHPWVSWGHDCPYRPACRFAPIPSS